MSVEEKGAPNTRKLMRSIDNMAGKISAQLDLISEDKKNGDGTEVELSSKFVDTFLKMVKDADKIKGFIDLVEQEDGIKTETTVTETTETVTVTKPLIELGDNAFEKVIKKVKAKKDGV